ncbi:hypothetical protein Q1W70_01780 [Pseudomonas kielensis]|uniref:hypothetical protein n=1 Tax=Pseudomonas kielensis TaxID=2762577 RepID=UPI00265FC52E|nr:hypothetical protein [Pseudomonas kielensis]WKL53345.1 hypothetical protein Q1W70_01780 [Pseudomonas kielensis]
MKKQHGPALVRSLIPMTECPSCGGKGVIKGLLHELDCIGCHASGFAHAQTMEPLLIEDLVVQLVGWFAGSGNVHQRLVGLSRNTKTLIVAGRAARRSRGIEQ